MTQLWDPVTVGAMTLQNRLAMSPMTRSRSTLAGVPTALNATYYGQRSAMGLVITEGTQPSDDGQGYMLTPGIYTADHVAGWRLVTEAAHANGAYIFVQLMHVGRISHPANTPHHRTPVAPSAVRPAGKMFTGAGPQDMPEPRAMTPAEIETTIGDFRHAARCAIEAGFDGVELHAANGYLLHQFLAENTNRRTDRYGGSIENRTNFVVEVAAAVAEAIGAQRTGIHISPGNPFNDIVEGDTAHLYKTLITKLAQHPLAYIHTVQAKDEELLRWFRAAWPAALIVNRADRPREAIAVDVDAGLADVASVARFALANPDLVDRLKSDAPLNAPDPATFYGGDERGYTDYPILTNAQPA